jgi:hypothetical protein
MKQILLAAAAALTLTAAASARDLHDDLVDLLPGIEHRVPDSVAPTAFCPDPNDSKTCQQIREKLDWKGTEVYRLTRLDFASGERHYCYQPSVEVAYRVCAYFPIPEDRDITAETFNGEYWVTAPTHDDRCSNWGGYFTVEYLACVAALPPKSA